MVTDPALRDLIVKVCGGPRSLSRGVCWEHTGRAGSQTLTGWTDSMLSELDRGAAVL